MGETLIFVLTYTLFMGLGLGFILWRHQRRLREARYIDVASRMWGRSTPDAPERAEQIFIAHLTPEQRRSFEKNRYIEEIVGLHRYRIRCDGSTSGNIEKRNLKRRYRGCIVFDYPYQHLHKYDLYLAQLLMLRARPKEFERLTIWSNAYYDD